MEKNRFIIAGTALPGSVAAARRMGFAHAAPAAGADGQVVFESDRGCGGWLPLLLRGWLGRGYSVQALWLGHGWTRALARRQRIAGPETGIGAVTLPRWIGPLGFPSGGLVVL